MAPLRFGGGTRGRARGNVDTAGGTLRISKSRAYGHEGVTKTRASKRTIPLLPVFRDALRGLKPVQADVDGYVFVNGKNGGPIDAQEWQKDHWRRALRALNIRPRRFYNTRHTFISQMLLNTRDAKATAQYCGASLQMLDRHYARYFDTDLETRLAQFAAALEPTRLAAVGGAKPETGSGVLANRGEKTLVE